MIMPCPCRVDCPGTDSPFANLTSEAPDQLIFIGYDWGNNLPNLGWNFGDPPNNPAFCDSPVSQQDADLCAGRTQVGCLVGDCGPGGSGPTIPWTDQNGNRIDTFFSEAAFCTVFCQDGLPFTYTVKAGLFRAFSQEQADKEAISYACNLANLNAVCFGSIANACLNQNYLSVISVTGGFAPYTIVRIGGVLPPGVGFVQDTGTTAFLSGIPTATGSYTFTVRAVDTKGNFMQKDFTVFVLAISNASTLPKPSTGTFYNQQLLGTGGVAPYAFSNPVGLPGGLTLQADGFVVGIPVGIVGTGFTCTMSDAAGNSCTQAVTFASACAFGSITWDSPPDAFSTPSVPNSSTFAVTFPTPHSIRLVGSATMIVVGQVLIYRNSNFNLVLTIPSGPARNCSIISTVRGSSGTNVYQAQVLDSTFAIVYGDTTQVINGPVGVVTTNFTIPAGVTQLGFNASFQCGLPAPATSGTLDIQIDFGV